MERAVHTRSLKNRNSRRKEKAQTRRLALHSEFSHLFRKKAKSMKQVILCLSLVPWTKANLALAREDFLLTNF